MEGNDLYFRYVVETEVHIYMCFVRENSIVVRIGIPREAQEVRNVAEIAGNQGEALSQEEVRTL